MEWHAPSVPVLSVISIRVSGGMAMAVRIAMLIANQRPTRRSSLACRLTRRSTSIAMPPGRTQLPGVVECQP
jgi:hypothetical protein